MPYHFIALAAGFLLDLLLGDPHFMPHPVRAMGWLITKLENAIRKLIPEKDNSLLWGGVLLVLLVTGISTGAALLLLWAAYAIWIPAGIAVEAVMCYHALATKSLKVESMKVYTALQAKDIKGARKAVSMIVGRDTEPLDEEGIAKAAIETVAENTSDGIIAPMLFMAIGGGAAGYFYKAVNTMDSMVGYRNDRYLYFGRCAAKLDDLCNYFPARIAAILIILAGSITGMDFKNGYRIWRRDSRNHASPNSAQTESAAAGCLQIRLAGDAWYFGKLHKKPFIGDEIRPVEAFDIVRVNRLLYGAAWLQMGVLAGIYWMIMLWLKCLLDKIFIVLK